MVYPLPCLSAMGSRRPCKSSHREKSDAAHDVRVLNPSDTPTLASRFPYRAIDTHTHVRRDESYRDMTGPRVLWGGVHLAACMHACMSNKENMTILDEIAAGRCGGMQGGNQWQWLAVRGQSGQLALVYS